MKQLYHGFSIIELIVVIAIIGILASITIVFLPDDRTQVNEAARILAANMKRARSEAILLNTNVAFRLNYTADTFEAFVDVDRDGTGDLDIDGDSVNDLTNAIIFSDALGARYPNSNMVDDTLGTSIWFDSRGLPRTATGGFASGIAKVVAKGDASYIVQIDLASQGRIEVVLP